MSPTLPSGGDLLVWLGRSSWQAAVLALLVLLVQAGLGSRLTAAWRYRLWLLVVVRLVLPVSLPSDLSVFNFLPGRSLGSVHPAPDRPAPVPGPDASVPPGLPPGIVEAQPPAFSGPPAGEVSPRRGVPAGNASDAGPAPVASNASGPGSDVRIPGPESLGSPKAGGLGREPGAGVGLGVGFRWGAVGLGVWLAGVAALLLRLAVQNLRFAREVRVDGRPGDERVRRLLDECRASLGVRREVRVCETGAVRTPALYGVFRPRLLLPTGLAARFSDDELRHVLWHELSHVRRQDLPVNGLVTVLQVLHWFNPVLWYAFRRMRADRELATDALALGAAGEARAHSYGETILKLLEGLAAPAPAGTALGILEDRARMRDRMRQIARYRRPSRGSILAALPAAFLAVVALTDARTREPEPAAAATASASASVASGAASATPAPAPGEGLTPVDLSGHVVTPWSSVEPGSSWDAVPKGRQTFSEVPFEVAGLVEVAGTGGLEYRREHPTRANGIRIGRKVGALHVLHGAGFAVPDGTAIARLVLRYANGQSRELPIRYGEHVRNWWDEPNDEADTLSDAQSRVAWTGRSRETDAFQVTLRLFQTRWANPLPDEVLESVDLVSTLTRCSEVLLGLSTEAPGAPVPRAFALTTVAGARSGAGAADREFFPVPLKAFCTRTYEVIDQDPDSSWAYAPHGRQVFNGVPFDLPGVMEVSGLGAARDDNPLPTSIRGIPLGRKASRLHLLHGGAADLADGTALAQLVLHYADGREHALRLVYGVNVRNWYKGGDKRDEVSDPNTKLGWTGDSPRSRRFGATLRIYHTAFDLPWPDVELTKVDFVSLLSESVSVVPAITLEAGGPGTAPPAAPAAAPRALAIPSQPASSEVLLQVVDAGTGRPVDGAVARVRAFDDRRDYKFGEHRATARGEVIVDVLHDGPTNRVVLVKAPGYLSREVPLQRSGKLLRALMVRLNPGVRIGGTVTDPGGRLVAGATVGVRGLSRDDAGQVVETTLDTVTTDAEGRWTTGSVPPPGESLTFLVTHPEFLPGDFAQDDDAALTGTRLKAGTARLTLQPAPLVSGSVVRAGDGTPVAEAEVVVASGNGLVNRRFTRSAADGRFRIAVPELGAAQVLVQAPGFAPGLVPVAIDPSMPAVNVSLAAARTVRGRVRDEQGRPIAGATVYCGSWRGVNLLTWRAETDAEGRFVWPGAPRETFRLVADKVGLNQVQEIVPEAPAGVSESDAEILMGREPVFVGRAIDAETRAPLRVLTASIGAGEDESPDDDVEWHVVPHSLEADGRFRVPLERGPAAGRWSFRILVSAPGYLPVSSPSMSPARPTEHVFELRKGKGLEGVVVGPDGMPREGVQVCLLGIGYLQLERGSIQALGARRGESTAVTDEEGRFTLLPMVPNPRLVAAHPEHGFAEISGEDLVRSGRIALRKWGRIEGELRVGSRPGTNAWIAVTAPLSPARPNLGFEFNSYRARTGDQDGRFALELLPPGEVRLVRLMPLGDSSWGHSHPVLVTVNPGETSRVVVGGTGRPLIGRVVSADPDVKIDWTAGYKGISNWRQPRRFDSPAEASAWHRSEEGRAQLRQQRQFVPIFQADGSFRVDDVPAGEYVAHFNFLDPAAQKGHQPITVAWVSTNLTVPDIPGGRSDEPWDVGVIRVATRTPAQSEAQRQEQEQRTAGGGDSGGGEALARFQTLGHGEVNAVEWIEKPQLAVVWSTTNTPASTEVLKEVDALRATLPASSPLVVVGVLTDTNHPTAQGVLKDLGIRWPQLLPNPAQASAMDAAFGNQRLPLTVLTVPGGRVTLGLRGAALKEAVEAALKPAADAAGKP